MSSSSDTEEESLPESQRVGWLKLPLKIRITIYRYCNLITKYIFALGPSDPTFDSPIFSWSPKYSRFFDLSNNHTSRQSRSSRWRVVPNQLFYVSRAISEEAIDIFYSKNDFSVSSRNQLVLLGNLSPTVLASLRSVTIDLDAIPRCSSGFFPNNGPAEKICNHESPDGSLFCEALMAAEWAHICVRFARHLTHSQLSLSISFEDMTPSPEFQEHILESFRKLPPLAYCAIRLDGPRNSKTQSLVETVALELAPPPAGIDYSSFRFNDLPFEIKRMVLEFLLVGPDPVTWGGTAWIPDPCLQCPANIDEGFYSWVYCPNVRNGYDTGAPCWRLPLSVFQINKEIREISQQLFFSKNEIVLNIIPPTFNFRRIPKWDIADLGQGSLQFLRRLTLRYAQAIRPYSFTYLKGQEHKSWVETVRRILEGARLETLTITLELEHSPYTSQENSMLTTFRSDESEAGRWEIYIAMLDIMKDLKGLKDLFVHIYSPMAERIRKERILERIVMGDKYDSHSRGKPPRKPVYWPLYGRR